MKFPAILSLLLVLCSTGVHAQKAPSLGEADTKWPGIRYVVYSVQRIPGDKVIFGIRIMATSHAPKEGTLIGIPVPIPPNADKLDIENGMYNPQPFSLESSTVTDEKTNQQYSAVKPDAAGNYLPAQILCTLRPLQGETVAVQFALPPPPPDNDGHPAKQTVSLLLTNAEKAIAKIPVPPPASSPSPSPSAH